MLSRHPPGSPRSLPEIVRLMEVYPIEWRRWCAGPERGGCACLGCVRQPAPSTVRYDPEYCEWPNPADALTPEEVAIYYRARKGHGDD